MEFLRVLSPPQVPVACSGRIEPAVRIESTSWGHERVQQLLAGWQDVRIEPDLAGVPRVIAAASGLSRCAYFFFPEGGTGALAGGITRFMRAYTTICP